MTIDDATLDPATMPRAFRARDGLVMLGSGTLCAALVAAAVVGPPPLPPVPTRGMVIALIACAFAAGVQLPLLARLAFRLRCARADARRLAARVRSDRAMFHELQHRVANALQFVASLLSLAAAKAATNAASRGDDHDDAEAVLEDAAARLVAMAVIHRRLHDPTLADAPLGETLRTLVRDLLRVRGREAVSLEVAVAAGIPPLGLARVSALASIVVEAVTNAVKHAFRDRDTGRLVITLGHSDGQLLLTIADDGPGPSADPPDPTSLGLLVMQAMAERLDGTFSLVAGTEGGAEVRVRFAAP
jgi:two-component sensor histidine kinase